jgi:hypothetical protein
MVWLFFNYENEFFWLQNELLNILIPKDWQGTLKTLCALALSKCEIWYQSEKSRISVTLRNIANKIVDHNP